MKRQDPTAGAGALEAARSHRARARPVAAIDIVPLECRVPFVDRHTFEHRPVGAVIDFAERIGLEPVVTVGHGENTQPGVRNPIRLSRTPVSYDLTPPGLDSGAELVRAWLGEDTAVSAGSLAGTPTRSPEEH